ncbi:MAG: ATP-binding cassette domain-containing protein [Terrimicrobiaceae bacterium]|nr:ATP-binding cassette domain-containing protein [Terrimicrobiaceae bacterium]
MRGVWTISQSGGTRDVELGAGDASIAVEDITLSTQWDASAATWKLRVTPAEKLGKVAMNGRALKGGADMRDGDVLVIGAVAVGFRRTPAPVRIAGREVWEIPIPTAGDLIFGRSGGETTPGAQRVELDADDPAISRRHVVIRRTGGRVAIKDESHTGTLLNGQRFDERELIIGDRFKIGLYAFEFTGLAIRRVKPRIGGRVEARSLVFEAGGRRILNNVSLDIAPCSFVGILGGSGQGKSTLMNALCGINPASSGEVLIEGEPLAGSTAAAGSGVGYVPQDDIVHRELTVEQAIGYSARLRLGTKIPAGEIDALVSEIIARLGLGEHRHKRISNLSGGQRKRVSIATELLDKPAVLFLDEPSSGLDPATEYALMKLLRRLAAHDCTVVCTTHVLGRAYLFDCIVFIHGGCVVFNGTSDEACEYFQVETLDQVYVNLAEAEKTPQEWEQEFLAWRREHPADSRPSIPAPARTAAEPKPANAGRGAGYFASLVLQIRRLGSILVADRLSPVFLVAQPVLIGLLVGWVAEDFVLRLFMCIVATLWFGCSNGAQQIVAERPIFRRERVCGLGLNSYLQSKYVFHGAITMLQAVALLLVTQTTALMLRPYDESMADFRTKLGAAIYPQAQPAALAAEEQDFVPVGEGGGSDSGPSKAPAPAKPADPAGFLSVRLLALGATFFEVRDNVLDALEEPGLGAWRAFSIGGGFKVLALALTAAVGVAIGLAISAIVETPTQAVMWVPLILIPQILFGGVVLKRPELSRGARALSYLSPSYSCQRLVDVSNLFGRAMPLLSNRTKIPLFLTPGEKEGITWVVAGRQYSEKYDKLSPVNTSWQNLTIIPAIVGEHRHEFTAFDTASGSVRNLIAETVSVRNDVLYRKGTIYQGLAPAGRSLLCLAIWIAAGYAVTIGALIAWQKGK